jgi:hypothetical protein
LHYLRLADGRTTGKISNDAGFLRVIDTADSHQAAWGCRADA